jgi:hypothetical protein
MQWQGPQSDLEARLQHLERLQVQQTQQKPFAQQFQAECQARPAREGHWEQQGQQQGQRQNISAWSAFGTQAPGQNQNPSSYSLFYLASSPKNQETKGLPPSNIGYNLPPIPNLEKSLGHKTAQKSSLFLEHCEEHTPTFALSVQHLPTKEYKEKLPPS